jgi:hypothetical protein
MTLTISLGKKEAPLICGSVPVTPNPPPVSPHPQNVVGLSFASAPAPNKNRLADRLRVTRDNVRFHDRPHLHRCAILRTVNGSIAPYSRRSVFQNQGIARRGPRLRQEVSRILDQQTRGDGAGGRRKRRSYLPVGAIPSPTVAVPASLHASLMASLDLLSN